MEQALAKLAKYKQAIDADIDAYAKSVRKTTLEQYGQRVLDVEVDLFLDMLQRGGKRIRGGLVMAGYEMCGGTDQKMIVQAARAIEMLQAYILIIDDIQDRSSLRRGKPTIHKLVEEYHQGHQLKGDPAHAGISLALMAAISGAHIAQTVLANLDADPERKIKVLSITNQTLAITAHGQTLDIMNELVDMPSEEDIERVLEWKTALYTVINPLQVGMVLAGAGCKVTTAISEYSHYAGKAFQITDDILGIFGDEKELGKTPGDDIREGKGTLLALYALQHANAEDRAFLRQCLGNQQLTSEEFEKCKQIIKASGALDYASQLVEENVKQATQALDKHTNLWSLEGTDLLKGLACALLSRTM
ncbi:polyprenyl synthetase family protein [Candidatus Saccharibacteria bacterium]|nr:polyprenyl synthetase family protein [Candidatus Saccharibacteria bacterium]